MKNLILIFVLNIISVKTFGQMPIDSSSKLFVYEGVVKVDSMNSEHLYNKAKEWIVRTLKSADNNINLNDKDHKSITSTGNTHLEDVKITTLLYYTDINLNYKFSIFFKDGRYKYIVENFYCSYFVSGISNGTSPKSEPFEQIRLKKKQKTKIYKDANNKILNLISDLERNIKPNSKKTNDW